MSKIFCFIAGFSWAIGWYELMDEPSKAFSAAVILLILAALSD